MYTVKNLYCNFTKHVMEVYLQSKYPIILENIFTVLLLKNYKVKNFHGNFTTQYILNQFGNIAKHLLQYRKFLHY